MPNTIASTFSAFRAPADSSLFVQTRGTDLISVWDNSAVAANDPDDPYSFLSATDSAVVTARRFIDPGSHLYLELSHHWTSDDTDDTVDTAPVIRVYGKLPNPSGLITPVPHRINAAFPDTLGDSGSDGFWIPLYQPGNSAQPLTLDGTAIRQLFDSDSDIYCVSDTKYVFTSGCTEFLVIVSTAATFTGGSGTRVGVITGRFSS